MKAVPGFRATMVSLLLLPRMAGAYADAPAPGAVGGAKAAPIEAGVVAPRPGVTYSSLDAPVAGEALIPAGAVALADAEPSAAFALYEKLSGRSVIPGDRLPRVRLSYRLEIALPRREVLQALDTLLAQYGVTMIVMGSNFVRAVNEAEAVREAAPEVSLPAEQLPDSSTYIQYAVRLQHRGVNSAIPVIQPLLRMPNSAMTIPSNNTLLLRDYSANVRRVLNLLKRYDVPDDGQVFDEPPRRGRRSTGGNAEPAK